MLKSLLVELAFIVQLFPMTIVPCNGISTHYFQSLRVRALTLRELKKEEVGLKLENSIKAEKGREVGLKLKNRIKAEKGKKSNSKKSKGKKGKKGKKATGNKPKSEPLPQDSLSDTNDSLSDKDNGNINPDSTDNTPPAAIPNGTEGLESAALKVEIASPAPAQSVSSAGDNRIENAPIETNPGSVNSASGIDSIPNDSDLNPSIDFDPKMGVFETTSPVFDSKMQEIGDRSILNSDISEPKNGGQIVTDNSLGIEQAAFENDRNQLDTPAANAANAANAPYAPFDQSDIKQDKSNQAGIIAGAVLASIAVVGAASYTYLKKKQINDPTLSSPKITKDIEPHYNQHYDWSPPIGWLQLGRDKSFLATSDSGTTSVSQSEISPIHTIDLTEQRDSLDSLMAISDEEFIKRADIRNLNISF